MPESRKKSWGALRLMFVFCLLVAGLVSGIAAYFSSGMIFKISFIAASEVLFVLSAYEVATGGVLKSGGSREAEAKEEPEEVVESAEEKGAEKKELRKAWSFWRVVAVVCLYVAGVTSGLIFYFHPLYMPALVWAAVSITALALGTVEVATGKVTTFAFGLEGKAAYRELLDRPVSKVKDRVRETKVDLSSLLEAERAGRGRGEVIDWLEGEVREERERAEEAEGLKEKVKDLPVDVVSAEEPLPVRWVSHTRRARNLTRRIASTLSQYIPQVARPISPYRFTAEHIFFFFIAIPFAVSAPVLAYFFHPLFLLFLALPLAAFVIPWVRLKIMIGDREREAEDELPFFAIHAALVQSSGMNLYEALVSTIGEGVLKRIEQGARLVKRNVQVLNMSPMRAIESLGRSHPHQETKRLLLGYTSEWRSGGNLPSYLQDKAEQHLRRAIHKWEDYRDDVATVAEIAITGLFILPILVLMSSVLSPDTASTMGLGFACLGIPLILALGFAMVRSTQPRDYTFYRGNRVLPFILGPLAFVISYAFVGLWVAVSLAVGAGLFVYALPVWLERQEAQAHEGDLPQFLRDVTEYQKLNYPLPRAIRTLYKEGKYSSDFNGLLGRVAGQLEVGIRLSEVKIPTRSWLTRLSFFYLGQIAESGGFTARSMELLTTFVGRIKDTRDEVRSSTNLYRYISLSTPVGLVLIVGLMMAMFQMFTLPTPETGGALALPAAGIYMFRTPPMFDVMAKLVILLSTVGLTFLTSYATHFTPKDLSWSALGAFVAAVSIELLPVVTDWLAKFLAF